MNRLFNKHIDNEAPEVRGKKILVAISGGCDSVLLTHLLQRNHFDIVLAHANFQLRGDESERDENFVRQFAAKRKLSLEVKKIKIKSKTGIQEKAREMRYAWFEEMASIHDCVYIATGHHADDNTETFLMHLIRGAGPRGLPGMSILDKNIFRPLLPFSRTEIEKVAKRLDLAWVSDSSNQSDKYTRNRIRNHVIPILLDINPALNETLQRTMSLMRENRHLVETIVPPLISKTSDGESQIEVKIIKTCGFPLSILHHWLEPVGFSSGQIREALKLTNSLSGKSISNGQYLLTRNRDFLHLMPTAPSLPEILVSEKDTNVLLGSYSFQLSKSNPKHKPSKASVNIDLLKAPFPWKVRAWQTGDRIKPTGMNGSKKISDLFIQHKIPLHLKDLIPVWECCGEVMWVCGLAVSRKFVSDIQTEKAINISFEKL